MIDLAGIPLHTADRGPQRPARRGRRARRVQPRAARRLHRRRRPRRGRGGRRPTSPSRPRLEAVRPHQPRGLPPRAVEDPRRLRAVDVRGRRTTASASPRSGPASPTCPPTVDKRTVADLGEWPYPRSPLVPLTEVVHDRLSVEVFRGCTRGCRFCQAGMITPPGPRAAGRPGPHDGPRGPAAHRATTRSASRRCPPPTSRASNRSCAASSPTTACPVAAAPTRSRSACRRCASTRSPSASPARWPAAAAAASPSPPRPGRGGCARSSTS